MRNRESENTNYGVGKHNLRRAMWTSKMGLEDRVKDLISDVTLARVKV